jgi:REP element-mobilizing transposase RayT
MTAPRQILPGRSYLVSRRCSERRFFLRPEKQTNDVFLYVLAAAARRYDVSVHAFCVLSNHYHLIVTDQRGNLPAFMQYLDSLVARAVNASLGRFEGFWARDASYSAVTPLDCGDVVAKVAYVLANPVASGLVRTGGEWPGLRSAPQQVGVARLVASRPKLFFAANGCMPEQVELELTAPPGFASPAEFSALVSSAVAELEARHRGEIVSGGRGFLGAARVLAQKPFARPAPGEPRFRLNPRIAARDKWKRIEAISGLKTFLRDYRNAWNARRAGAAQVLFPAGTYLLRIFHAVPCVSAS